MRCPVCGTHDFYEGIYTRACINQACQLYVPVSQPGPGPVVKMAAPTIKPDRTTVIISMPTSKFSTWVFTYPDGTAFDGLSTTGRDRYSQIQAFGNAKIEKIIVKNTGFYSDITPPGEYTLDSYYEKCNI